MEDIIRLFNANETNFDHNETILTDVLSFESEVEENGISYCEMTCPLDDRIEEGKIIKAPTPIGEQLFRIIKINKNLPAMTLYVYGRHISYDLLNNMLLNIRPTATTQQNALNAILTGTEYPHPFTATSDVPGVNTANYVRINPIQAIMGADNSALTLWGGFLRRDNFLIKVLATSPDKGYEVRFGKNLLGVDEELDMTEVVTRLYPTVVIQEPTVTALPEKYVDSPLINSYPKPIIKEYRITLTDEEKLLTLAQIYTLMRARCAEQWTLKADQPKVNYKVDFVELRKTEQYKNFAVLEELDISDTVWAYVSPLNLNMSARMIKYRHDGLNDRYLSMELGNFKPKLTSQKAEFVKLVKDATKDLTDGVITAMLKDAVDRIQGNLGGNVVTITANGKPVATAYMDTADVATANKYVILNNMGIAFGINGLNNPPELAIDINGSVVGNSAFFRSITTNLIQSELGSNLVLSSNTSIKLLSNTNVTINDAGLDVSNGTDDTHSLVTPSGLNVLAVSNNAKILSATDTGVEAPMVKAGLIYGDNIINAVNGSRTLYVATTATGDGSGRDASNKADSIYTALTLGLEGAKYLKDGTIITISLSGSITEDVYIGGFIGSGTLIIDGSSPLTTSFKGSFYGENTQIEVIITNCRIYKMDTAAATALFTADNTPNLYVIKNQIIGNGIGWCHYAWRNGGIHSQENDIIDFEQTYRAWTNSIVSNDRDIGSRAGLNGYVAFAGYGGKVALALTRPLSGTPGNISGTASGGSVDVTDAVGTASAMSPATPPPAPGWTSQTKTFYATRRRENVTENNWFTDGEFGQGKSVKGIHYRGHAYFYGVIKSWLQGSGGYQAGTVTMRLRGKRGTLWGQDTPPVALKLTSPYIIETSAVTRGSITPWTALSASARDAIIAGNDHFNTTTSSTGDYSEWEWIQVEVTVSKKS